MPASVPPPSPARPSKYFNGIAVAAAVLALLISALLIGRYYFGPQHSARQTVGSAPSGGEALIGGPFTLVDQDGRTVTDRDFRDKYMLVYFGFTFCPDVCPTSLQRNSDALDLLGDKANAIVPILITVDPARDTPERMKDYVHHFRPGLVGLTGAPEQIAAAAKAYRVFYAKVDPGKIDPGKVDLAGAQPDKVEPGKPGSDGMYMVDHSSLTYLMGPDGRFLQFFRHELTPDEMATRLKKALAGG